MTAPSAASRSPRRAIRSASATIPNMRRPPTGSPTARWSRRRPPTITTRPRTGSRRCKVQRIPSGYDPGRYVTERIMVPARDGRQIPVSIVYRRGFRAQRPGPALPLRLRRLRHRHPAGLHHQPDQPARPRLRLSPSPISAAATTWAIDWYLDGKLDPAHQHVQRFRRRRARPDRRRITPAPAISPSRAARPAAS